MKGQWSGEWGKDEQRLLLDLDWDGKDDHGSHQPGRQRGADQERRRLPTPTPEPASGTSSSRLKARTPRARPSPIEVDGVLENIGSAYRVYHGTWTQGGVKGDFTVTRN